jgi:hypothetical protein
MIMIMMMTTTMTIIMMVISYDVSFYLEGEILNEPMVSLNSQLV